MNEEKITAERIAELRRLHEAATPGRLTDDRGDGSMGTIATVQSDVQVFQAQSVGLFPTARDHEQRKANARALVALWNASRSLLALARRGLEAERYEREAQDKAALYLARDLERQAAREIELEADLARHRKWHSENVDECARLAAEVERVKARLEKAVADIDARIERCGCEPEAFCESFGCATLAEIRGGLAAEQTLKAREVGNGDV